LYPLHTRQEKIHAHFPRKKLFIALHHGLDFILIGARSLNR
jgi:hypothetical protein